MKIKNCFPKCIYEEIEVYPEKSSYNEKEIVFGKLERIVNNLKNIAMLKKRILIVPEEKDAWKNRPLELKDENLDNYKTEVRYWALCGVLNYSQMIEKKASINLNENSINIKEYLKVCLDNLREKNQIILKRFLNKIKINWRSTDIIYTFSRGVYGFVNKPYILGHQIEISGKKINFIEY